MPQTNIINVINFIRAVEPRNPEMDLVEPVRQQIQVLQAYKLPATWLLQYDALLDERFVGPLKKLGREHEIGLWFEVVQPLAEAAGLTWRGRYPWDWHSHVGFSIGYTPEEREKLTDVFMAKFKETFGVYPASAGSWFMDAHLIGYLYEKYHIGACCNCKDQWGTDGYSLWGGYYNQAYYPSKKNAFMPAQHSEKQIHVPIFRMLGSDPIYQYDCGLGQGEDGGAAACQQVVTLEPAYPDGGGNEAWVRWFGDVNFRAPALSFGYAQAGQENSFGWPTIAKGFTLQMQLFAQWRQEKQVRVETLRDSARWFRQNYAVTPASAITALRDSPLGQGDRKSVWYHSRFYRCNLYWEREQFWLRDLHRFDENYAERYLRDICTTANCTYDTLPILDGFRWSGAACRAKLELVELHDDKSCSPIASRNPTVEQDGENLIIRWTQPAGVTITCQSRNMDIGVQTSRPWALRLSWSEQAACAIRGIQGDSIQYLYENTPYALRLPHTIITQPQGKVIQITPRRPEQAVTLELGLC